jgi:Rrf2 family protein
MSSIELARSLKTNPAFVRRLVRRLVEAGLIQSSRGKGGGITLARPPKEITLKDIYIASLQDKQLVCLPKKSPKISCPVSCSMTDVLAKIVNGIENSTQKYLAEITLEQIVNSIE